MLRERSKLQWPHWLCWVVTTSLLSKPSFGTSSCRYPSTMLLTHDSGNTNKDDIASSQAASHWASNIQSKKKDLIGQNTKKEQRGYKRNWLMSFRCLYSAGSCWAIGLTAAWILPFRNRSELLLLWRITYRTSRHRRLRLQFRELKKAVHWFSFAKPDDHRLKV